MNVLSIETVAKLHGISKTAIYKAIERGDLEFVKGVPEAAAIAFRPDPKKVKAGKASKEARGRSKGNELIPQDSIAPGSSKGL